MRKIRLFIAASLDGYIARESGEIDWLFTDQDYGYTEFFNQVDTVIMGNKTYQQILGFGEYPYTGKEAFVFSQNQSSEKDDNVKFISSNWQDFINQIRQTKGRDIWLVGGARIIHWFLKHGFIDELILSIHPIILGSGIPLILHDSTLETMLILKDVTKFDTGLLQIAYDFQIKSTNIKSIE